jgi:hypothetical protein
MTSAIARSSWEIAEARRRAVVRRRRRQHHRSLVGLTDRAIHRLEELNLADRGGCPPDPTTAQAIDEALEAMPTPVRRCFPGSRTVQQALDGLFIVQEALQRRHGLRSPWDDAAAD